MKPDFLNRIPPRGRMWLLRLILVFAVYSLVGFVLKVSLLIGVDRRPNLSLVLKKDSAADTAPTSGSSTNPPADPIPVELGTLALEGVSFAFTDESVQPHVVAGIAEVGGTIKGLSTAPNSTADIDLHGRVEEQSPFSITGRVNPFADTMFVDLVFTNANLQLMTLRARWVQDWLVQTGHVSGDQLLLVSPKPVDATYRGESRVNLSLN